MRTQSRLHTTFGKRWGLSTFTLLISTLVIVVSQSTWAGPIAERLDYFVSKNADVVISAFGAPALTTADRLSYTFNSHPADPNFSAPAPVDRFALGDSVVTGNGLTLQGQPHQVPLPCLIDFYIDETQKVEEVSYRGPGCYEIVYSRTIQP